MLEVSSIYKFYHIISNRTITHLCDVLLIRFVLGKPICVEYKGVNDGWMDDVTDICIHIYSY